MVELVTTKAASGDIAAQRQMRDEVVSVLAAIPADSPIHQFRYLTVLAGAESAARLVISHPDSTADDASVLLSLFSLTAAAADAAGDRGYADAVHAEGICLVEFVADGGGPAGELASQAFNQLVAEAPPSVMAQTRAWHERNDPIQRGVVA